MKLFYQSEQKQFNKQKHCDRMALLYGGFVFLTYIVMYIFILWRSGTGESGSGTN